MEVFTASGGRIADTGRILTQRKIQEPGRTKTGEESRFLFFNLF